MKAVVFRDIGDIRLEDVPAPKLKDPHDAIVKITASAICGTDLHMVRGTMGGMEPGTILGHEGVGIVSEVGPEVRNLTIGDRVVVCSSIGCGYCAYCRDGYFSQCDNANPNGKRAGTAFFGGPKMSGPFHGLQAEMARIPYANINVMKLPDEITDDQAIMLSDIFPTGYFGADNAHLRPGHTVAVLGCGPVGLFAIMSCFLMSAGRVFAVDTIPSRLDMARDLGAEVINFNEDDPVQAILDETGGIGVDRVIEAVGIDAVPPKTGPAAEQARQKQEQFKREVIQAAPRTSPRGGNWIPGDAPSQALEWAVDSVAKAGIVSIVGVYPETVQFFPFGKAMARNLVVRAGNCNHRRYLPQLIELVRSGAVDPREVLSNIEPLTSVLDAYKAFDQRKPGWIKVEIAPQKEKRAA
jgi:threonine dehydrogenase-like Zn-dependent dehydrogenase